MGIGMMSRESHVPGASLILNKAGYEMARPRKEGLDYFPHDVHASADEKLEALLMLYGAKGYAFYFLHLEYIYRRDDLEMDVSDDEVRQVLCNKLQITQEEYTAILNTALKRGCFDAEYYGASGRLTSNGIKKRGRVVTGERERWYARRANSGATPEELRSNPGDSEENSGVTPEAGHKGKERKGKERKEKDFPPLTPPPGGGADDALPDSEPEEAEPDEPEPPPPAPRNACPHEAIIALYHESLPECPHVRVWPDKSRKQLAARWREDKERQNLDWWRGVFGDVAQSDFLMGRKDGTDFKFSLTWFVQPGNFAKVLNGNYTNRASPPGNNRPQYPQPMTAQQRYMRELGDALRNIEEAKHGDPNRQPDHNPGLAGTRPLLGAAQGTAHAVDRAASHLWA